jgi:hypothetical protein
MFVDDRQGLRWCEHKRPTMAGEERERGVW